MQCNTFCQGKRVGKYGGGCMGAGDLWKGVDGLGGMAAAYALAALLAHIGAALAWTHVPSETVT
jgi:hypothetical protein